MPAQQIKCHLQKKPVDMQSAIDFAYAMAYKWYQCAPAEIPEHIFAARYGSQVVSTVGVTDSRHHHILPLRHLYEIDSSQLPADWNWHHVSQLGWFFSAKKGHFMPLLCMALNFCHLAQHQYAILQMKPIIFTLLTQKGLNLVPIESAKLHVDPHALKDKAYYLECSPVQLYYLDIKENIFSLQSEIY